MITIAIMQRQAPKVLVTCCFLKMLKHNPESNIIPFLSMQFVEESHSFCFRIEEHRCQEGFLLFSGFHMLLTKHFPVGWTVLVECVPAVY